MSDLTAKFTALEEQIAAQAAATDALIDTVEAKLQLIFDTLDVINVNGAVNTRALLAAMHQNSPCTTCDPVDISVPPTSPDDNPVNEDKCKRTQAFIHAMTEVFGVLDVMSAFGVPFTPSLITDAINQVITALANGDPTPLPSFPEMIQIVGDGVNYVAGGFFVGDTLAGYFAPLVFDLQAAIYAATSPAGAQSAYNSVIDASEAIPNYAKPLMKDAAYNELWSFYLDPASDVNLTGYDGSICAPEGECVTITVPEDEGTSTYVFSGDTYSRIVLASTVIGDRLQSSSTIQSATRITASFGAIVCFIEADELITWSDLGDRCGVLPSIFDSNTPNPAMAVEFCNLVPE